MVIPCTCSRISNLWALCFFLLLFFNVEHVTLAQEQPTTPQLATQTVLPTAQSQEPLLAPTIVRVLTAKAGIGNDLHVLIDSASAYAIEHNRLSYRELELFLDGMRFHSLHPEFVSPNILSFHLTYDDSSHHEWRTLLGTLEGSSHVTRVGMGFEGEQEIIPTQGNPATLVFTFIVYREGWFLVAIACIVLATGLFWLLALRSNILRDSVPVVLANGEQRPYSLARCQMALWFFIIIISYLFIFMLTGQYNNVLNTQALFLLSIGTTTALGAALIDSNKSAFTNRQIGTLQPQQDTLEAERASLTAQLQVVQEQAQTAAAMATPPQPTDSTTATPQTTAQPPSATTQTLAQVNQTLKGQIADKETRIASLQTRISELQSTQSHAVSQGFFLDILSDHTGISFSRFQIVMWTLVLAAIFCVEVYENLLMPTFNTTLLALMGISSGTYLGFKIPEQQSPQATASTASASTMTT